jgi:hypothetical protein
MKSDNLTMTQKSPNISFEENSGNQFPWRISTSKAIPRVFRPQPSKSIFVILGSRNFLFRIVCKNVRHSSERIKDLSWKTESIKVFDQFQLEYIHNHEAMS